MKLQHRENELENLKKDYIQSVSKSSSQLDAEVKRQHDLALLRATEKKLESDQKCAQLEKLLQQKDEYIAQLEQQLERAGIRI